MNPSERGILWTLPAGLAAVLITAGIAGWFTQPDRYVQGHAPPQPIPFSHALHAGSLRIPCGYCHSGAARSRNAGIPSVETCMGCHQVTATDRPSIQLLRKVFQEGRTLPWRRVHTLPDHVFFDHRPHVAAGLACQSCHGEVQTMPVLTRRMAMRMADCLDCHREAQRRRMEGVSNLGQGVGPYAATAAEHCSACHR